MITFNLFLSTDSNDYGDFFDWAEEFIGKEQVELVTKKASAQTVYKAVWKLVVNKDKNLQPISVFNGELLVGFPCDLIGGVMEKGESIDHLQEEYRNSDQTKNIFFLYSMQYKISALIDSDLSAYEISKAIGVSESTIKYQRTHQNTSVGKLSITTMRKLLTYPDLDNIVEKMRK